MTIAEELGLVTEVGTFAAEFAAGQAVSGSKQVGNWIYTGAVVKLPTGPNGTQYVPFSGSLLAILSIAFEDYIGFSNGQAVYIAEKIGNDWYGTTLSATPAPK
jgi:hypothetical protein